MTRVCVRCLRRFRHILLLLLTLMLVVLALHLFLSRCVLAVAIGNEGFPQGERRRTHTPLPPFSLCARRHHPRPRSALLPVPVVLLPSSSTTLTTGSADSDRTQRFPDGAGDEGCLERDMVSISRISPPTRRRFFMANVYRAPSHQ